MNKLSMHPFRDLKNYKVANKTSKFAELKEMALLGAASVIAALGTYFIIVMMLGLDELLK